MGRRSRVPRCPLVCGVTWGLCRGRPGPALGDPPIWRCASRSVGAFRSCVGFGAARCPLRGEEGRAGWEREGPRAESARARPSRARSYKLYCDALTTTDGPCQTFPRLAALSTFRRTMGPEWGTRPAACSRCICAGFCAPAQYLIPGNQSPLGVSDFFKSALSKEHIGIDLTQVLFLKT